MNRKRLSKIKLELDAMYRSPFGHKSRDLRRLAYALGRRRFDRGSEPNYVRTSEPRFTYPLSIPSHPTIKPGTLRNIIRFMLDDIATWEEWLDQNAADDDEI